MGIFDFFSRFFRRSEPRRFVPEAPSLQPTQGRRAPEIPALETDLKRDVVYQVRLLQPFDRIAQNLGLMAAEDALLLASRVATEHRRIDELAVELGVLSRADADRIIDEQDFAVSVNSTQAGNPAFLSWIGALVRQGIIPKVTKVSAQDLAKRDGNEQGGEGKREEVDLQTLDRAVEILLDCAAIGGSDLHVLQRAKHTELQVRVKGELKTIGGYSLKEDDGDRLVRAMVMGLATSKPTTYNPLDFQDAQIAGWKLPRSDLSSVRIIRGPSWPEEAGGAFLVARLQYHGIRRHSDAARAAAARKRLQLRTPNRPEGEFRLSSMGFLPDQVEKIIRLMWRPQGILFVTGPTGSGKTTTIFEMVLQLLRLFPGKRVTTIENPPEYPIEEGVQLTSESEQFPDRLKKALRMDPDTVLPSEVRGHEEAIAAIQAAQTGHRVLSSLHVSDPFETFARIEMLGNEKLPLSLICNHQLITGLIAQRKVSILCPDCKRPFAEVQDSIPAFMRRALESWGDLSHVHVRGNHADCPTCGGDQIVREQAVAEVIVTDEELMADCREIGVLEAAKKYRAREDADLTMMEHAMALVLAGNLDPQDAADIDEIPMKRRQA